MSEAEYVIRPLEREDREWVAHFLDEHWGSTQIVTRGRALYGHLLPGFVAERPKPPDEIEEPDEPEDDDETAENPVVHMEKIGLLTYNIEDSECEITTLDSQLSNSGVGTALVDKLKEDMKDTGVSRLWLITTNDNLPALKFWQKREFRIVAVHRDAIEVARRLKPQIPITGHEGIPIHDEIELEYTFS
jgi:ribosomal protein S18 acetylase RimI-like enzyme